MHCPRHFPHFLQYNLASIIVIPYFLDPTCIHSNTDNVPKCNIEVHSCNYCSSGKAISITYFEHVFVALGIQHAMLMRYIAFYDLPASTLFFPHYLVNGRISEKYLPNTECVFQFSLQLLTATSAIL